MKDFLYLQLNAEFSQKLKKCTESLLVLLDKNLQLSLDRDHDYSIYTGTAGIALLFYHISFLQNTKKFLKVSVPFLAGLASVELVSLRCAVPLLIKFNSYFCLLNSSSWQKNC
jgi:hypothetical protein